MVEGIREQVLSLSLMDEEAWDRGIRDMLRANGPDSPFWYTFIKGICPR